MSPRANADDQKNSDAKAPATRPAHAGLKNKVEPDRNRLFVGFRSRLRLFDNHIAEREQVYASGMLDAVF